MKSFYRTFSGLMLLVIFLVACTSNPQRTSNPVMVKPNAASGSVVIDETQIMWVVGGDIGGGTLEFKGQSYKFKIDGLKLGGFGVHKIKMTGDVWDLNDVADFPGVYAEAEVGYTAADAGKGDFWMKNDKGVKLRLKSPESKGIALDLGVEGADIRMK